MRVIFLTILIFFFSTRLTFASSIVINEIMPHPSSGGDWVEIYNPTSSNIDLSNWTLVDSTSTMKTLSGNIPANGFLTFDVSNRLNNSGDTIYLKDSSGSTIDSYSYNSDPGIDISLGRSPDGGDWTTLATSSKGSNNSGSSTPSPSSTTSPTSAPSPTSSSTSTSSNSTQFTISNTPSQITSDEIFTVSVSLSLPNSPNTSFYLKGAFKKADGSNYFGQTLVSGSWIKNGSTYSNQYPITTDSSGNWSGNLEIQPDSEDSGFEGSGDYIFKVGRYTQSGSGPTWSNEATIKIISTSSNDNADQGSSETSNSTSPQTTPATLKGKTQITTPPKKYDSLTYRTSSIAGETISSTSSAIPSAEESTPVKERKFFNLNIWAILGSIFIIAGLGSLGFIYLRSKKIK